MDNDFQPKPPIWAIVLIGLVGFVPSGFAGYTWMAQREADKQRGVKEEAAAVVLRSGSSEIHALTANRQQSKEEMKVARDFLVDRHWPKPKSDADGIDLADVEKKITSLIKLKKTDHSLNREQLRKQLVGELIDTPMPATLAQPPQDSLVGVKFGPLSETEFDQLKQFDALKAKFDPEKVGADLIERERLIKKWVDNKGAALSNAATSPSSPTP